MPRLVEHLRAARNAMSSPFRNEGSPAPSLDEAPPTTADDDARSNETAARATTAETSETRPTRITRQDPSQRSTAHESRGNQDAPDFDVDPMDVSTLTSDQLVVRDQVGSVSKPDREQQELPSRPLPAPPSEKWEFINSDDTLEERERKLARHRRHRKAFHNRHCVTHEGYIHTFLDEDHKIPLMNAICAAGNANIELWRATSTSQNELVHWDATTEDPEADLCEPYKHLDSGGLAFGKLSQYGMQFSIEGQENWFGDNSFHENWFHVEIHFKRVSCKDQQALNMLGVDVDELRRLSFSSLMTNERGEVDLGHSEESPNQNQDQDQEATPRSALATSLKTAANRQLRFYQSHLYYIKIVLLPLIKNKVYEPFQVTNAFEGPDQVDRVQTLVGCGAWLAPPIEERLEFLRGHGHDKDKRYKDLEHSNWAAQAIEATTGLRNGGTARRTPIFWPAKPYRTDHSDCGVSKPYMAGDLEIPIWGEVAEPAYEDICAIAWGIAAGTVFRGMRTGVGCNEDRSASEYQQILIEQLTDPVFTSPSPMAMYQSMHILKVQDYDDEEDGSVKLNDPTQSNLRTGHADKSTRAGLPERNEDGAMEVEYDDGHEHQISEHQLMSSNEAAIDSTSKGKTSVTVSTVVVVDDDEIL